MTVTATVLFDMPQSEIASLLMSRMSRSTLTSIVTGFATPRGVNLLSQAVRAQPTSIAAVVLGSATYPGFEALDDLLAAGVAPDRVFVHLGHTRRGAGNRNPFVRYHPMLHSKIYYMELPAETACAFIGSHNLTSYALNGQNGEASVLLEGPRGSAEFDAVRNHIANARSQAAPYTTDMKEAYAWWARQFLDGLAVEIDIPKDASTVRTILVFCTAARADRPRTDQHLYFEIPAGIEQIESIKTEVHLFVFDQLPTNITEALVRAGIADASYTCEVRGVESGMGNKEVSTDWQIEVLKYPHLKKVVTGTLRPSPSSGMQQVRARVKDATVTPFEYLFSREKAEWDPVYSKDNTHRIPEVLGVGEKADLKFINEGGGDWILVQGLAPRLGAADEKDSAALRRASPESGSFILVSLRRRKRQARNEGQGE